MADIPELWKQVATEVEDLISQNSYAVERFKEQIRVCNRDWQPYWQSLCDEPPPYDDPTGKNGKPGYEYDANVGWWFPKDVKRPPDPTVGECKDRYPCYYMILAVIYDSVKGEVAPFLLCDGILDHGAFRCTKIADKTRDRDMLYTAIKWVKSDLAKGTWANVTPQGTKSKESREIVRLESFMERHCRSYKGTDLKSRKQAIYKADKSGKIKLPKPARRYAKGKPNVYYADELKTRWNEFSRQVDLPPLQSAEN